MSLRESYFCVVSFLLPNSFLLSFPIPRCICAHNDQRGPVSDKVDDCAHPILGVNEKHWAQRYRYFSKFDEGIRVDFEGWYSITPEAAAEHIAKRVAASGARVVFDAFCGCGGNAIAFARHCKLVISVDIGILSLVVSPRSDLIALNFV